MTKYPTFQEVKNIIANPATSLMIGFPTLILTVKIRTAGNSLFWIVKVKFTSPIKHLLQQ